MSDEETKAETWQVLTVDGTAVKVRCPICGSDRFGSARPPLKQGAGFVHVSVGHEVEKGVMGRLLGIPTKSKYCLNCGFILKFMFFQSEQGSVGDDHEGNS